MNMINNENMIKNKQKQKNMTNINKDCDLITSYLFQDSLQLLYIWHANGGSNNQFKKYSLTFLF